MPSWNVISFDFIDLLGGNFSAATIVVTEHFIVLRNAIQISGVAVWRSDYKSYSYSIAWPFLSPLSGLCFEGHRIPWAHAHGYILSPRRGFLRTQGAASAEWHAHRELPRRIELNRGS